jgi:hypothetical protein
MSLVLETQRGATTSDYFHSGYGGVTPVLTVMFPSSSSGKKAAVNIVTEVSTALNCLAPVTRPYGRQQTSSGAKARRGYGTIGLWAQIGSLMLLSCLF